MIREETKSWEVPYCSRCLDHIDAHAELAGFSRFVPHLPVILCLGGAVAVAGAVPFLARVPVVGALVLGSIWAVIVGLGVYALFPWSRRTHARMLRRRERDRRDLADRLDRYLTDDCAEDARLAAEYDGWDGSIHRFYFTSRQFADEFRRANAGKVLG